MNVGYLLVVLIFWNDPRPTELRYEVRFVGHYNTLARCEQRRAEMGPGGSNGSILWSECRQATGAK